MLGVYRGSAEVQFGGKHGVVHEIRHGDVVIIPGGVAHKKLPCGTRVTFYHDGRFLTVPVIDRGPFRRGVAWDLTAAAAKQLGFRTSGRLTNSAR